MLVNKELKQRTLNVMNTIVRNGNCDPSSQSLWQFALFLVLMPFENKWKKLWKGGYCVRAILGRSTSHSTEVEPHLGWRVSPLCKGYSRRILSPKMSSSKRFHMSVVCVCRCQEGFLAFSLFSNDQMCIRILRDINPNPNPATSINKTII